MAFVHSSNAVDSNNVAVSELLCPLSANDSGDLAVVVISSSQNAGTFQQKTGTTGWTLHNNTATGGDTYAIFYKFVGASEADPTFDDAGALTGYMDAVITIVKGAHATPIITYSIAAAAQGKSFNIDTIDTTGTNDALVLLTCTSTADNRAPVYSATINYYAASTISNNAINAGWFQQPVGGVTPAIPIYRDRTDTVTIGQVIVAIKDDGTGAIKGHVTPTTAPAELVQGCFESHASGSNVTGIVPTLDGNTVTSGGFGTISDVFNNINSEPSIIKHTSNSSTPNHQGYSFYDATIDLTDSLIQISIAPGAFDSSLAWDSGGRYMMLISGADAGADVWKVEAADTVLRVKSGNFPYILDTSMSAYETHGTFDITDVTKWGFGIHRDTTTNTTIGYIYKLGTMEMSYGSALSPCSFLDAARHAKTASLRTVQGQGGQAKSQFYISQNIQIGNNATDAVYWVSTNQSVEFPGAYDVASRFVHHQISQGGLTCTIRGGVGDTIDLSNTIFNMGDFHNWTLNSNVAVTTNNTVVITGNVILTANASTALTGAVFAGCNVLPVFDYSGGCTISGSAATEAIVVTSEAQFDDLANCSFIDNNRAIQITGNQSGTWSDPNFTVSGNTYDIEYTGTTNFSIQSAATLSVNNASSGVLTIITPVTSFTINSSESSSLIQIFTTATQTVLASATGSTLNHVYTGAVVVDYVVQKAGFLPQRFVAVTLTDSTTAVNLPPSREYDSGHGLTYTTDASWSRSLNQLTVPTWGVTGQGVFSLMMDSFIAQSSLFNTAFNLEMDGASSLFLTNDAEGASDASITNMIECGCAYLDTSSVTTASFVGVKSVGTATGFTGEFQQIDGTTTTDARTTGIFNEIIKMYGDASHGNFDYRGHLVLKFQPNTYRESRSDVLADFGISTMGPTLYIIAMEPVAIGIASGDPAISITIVDHTGAPLVVGGKSFDYEIQDNGANDGTAMLREVNYNLSQDATYQGKDPFNWPEMLLQSGSTFETIRGLVEGVAGDHGIYVSRSAADHPDFTRHQSNDGTYYVVPITANASISTIVSGSRVRIYNETTTTETYNDLPGTSFSDSYTEGTTYTAGDVISIYITQTSGVTAQAEYSTSAIASSSGWAVIAAQVSDDVYDTNGIDGSTVTKFTADYVNDEIDVTTAVNFTGPEVYAFYMHSITSAAGIASAFGGFTALDAGNYRNNVGIVGINLDNTTTTEVWQTDTSRIFKSDGTRPVRNPTSGGGGIDVNWQNVVYVVTAGSGLTAGQAAELTDASAAATVNTKIGTPAVTVSDDIAAIPVSDATLAKQNTIISDIAAIDVWNTVMTEGYAAKGAAMTPSQALHMIWSDLRSPEQVTTTWTDYELDDTTSSMTFTLDDATAPTKKTRAT